MNTKAQPTPETETQSPLERRDTLQKQLDDLMARRKDAEYKSNKALNDAENLKRTINARIEGETLRGEDYSDEEHHANKELVRKYQDESARALVSCQTLDREIVRVEAEHAAAFLDIHTDEMISLSLEAEKEVQAIEKAYSEIIDRMQNLESKEKEHDIVLHAFKKLYAKLHPGDYLVKQMTSSNFTPVEMRFPVKMNLLIAEIDLPLWDSRDGHRGYHCLSPGKYRTKPWLQ